VTLFLRVPDRQTCIEGAIKVHTGSMVAVLAPAQRVSNVEGGERPVRSTMRQEASGRVMWRLMRQEARGCETLLIVESSPEGGLSLVRFIIHWPTASRDAETCSLVNNASFVVVVCGWSCHFAVS